MSDDQTIVDSAERMNRDQQRARTAQSESRNRTIRIVGVSLALSYLGAQLLEQSVSCAADSRAQMAREEADYMRSLAECEQRQGAGQCWRMQYVWCLKSKSEGACKVLNPNPTPSWF